MNPSGPTASSAIIGLITLPIRSDKGCSSVALTCTASNFYPAARCFKSTLAVGSAQWLARGAQRRRFKQTILKRNKQNNKMSGDMRRSALPSGGSVYAMSRTSSSGRSSVVTLILPLTVVVSLMAPVGTAFAAFAPNARLPRRSLSDRRALNLRFACLDSNSLSRLMTSATRRDASRNGDVAGRHEGRPRPHKHMYKRYTHHRNSELAHVLSTCHSESIRY